MKQAGFKQDSAVFTIRDGQGINSILFQKCYNALFVSFVTPEHPIARRGDPADRQPAAVGIEVGACGRDPEIDADGSIIGVDIDR